MGTSSYRYSPFILLFLCAFAGLQAQYSRLGIPETVNFPKDIYGAGTQNWAITQDESGLMLFANNKGVLVFDGANWELIPLPNRTIVRSLAKGPQGRIYVGGQDEFGYLDRDECQRICYRSLSQFLPADRQSFEDVWKVFATEEGIFFCAQKSLMKWDGKEFKITPASRRFGNFFWLAGQLYAQENGKGLLQWTNGKLEEVPGGNRFENARIAAMLPLQDDILIVSDFQGLFRIVDGEVQVWETAVSAFLKRNQAYCAIGLPDNQIGIGTAQNGLLIIDERGQGLEHLSKSDGLQNNTILALYQDRLDNLWLATDNGIDYVKTASPFSLIRDYAGIDGTGYASTLHDGRLYLGTNQGLFYFDWPVGQQALSQESAQEITALNGQIWGFSHLGETMFVNTHAGLFRKAGQQFQAISSRGSWKIIPFGTSGELALEGGYTGLHIYRKNPQNGQWEYSHKIAGFEESARVFELGNDGSIWVSHAYKGLFRLELTEDMQAAEVQFYGYEKGLPTTISLNVLKVQDELIATTPEGAYRYNSTTDKFEIFDDLNSLLGGAGPISRLIEDEDGRLWFSKGEEFGYFEIQQSRFLEEPTVDRVFFNHVQEYLVDGFEHVLAIDSSTLIIATERGFIRYNPQRREDRDMSLNVLIREVNLINAQDSILYSDGLSAVLAEEAEQAYVLPKALNSLRFSFAAPFYEQTQELQYRYRLLGFQEEWSPWTSRRVKEYTNLPAGNYSFVVQAQNTYGALSAEEAFSFEVLPPWYASLWARIFYVFLVAGFFVFLFAYFSRRMRKQRTILVAKQAETLALKEAEFQEEKEKSAEEIDKLRNEKLTADVQHKTSQLASATMHLVQKGEVLLKIKKDLSKILKGETTDENRRKLQRIINTIDGDVRLDSNWEQFEIYFDQVHKNFLRDLRATYPELTPKDQKLCAYLRMNLTTKEIAATLNVLPDSILKSKYRLKKKLELDKETDLVAFLSSL